MTINNNGIYKLVNKQKLYRLNSSHIMTGIIVLDLTNSYKSKQTYN